MKIEIKIEKRHLAYLVFTIAVLTVINYVVAYGGQSPSIMGHSWGEVACSGCVGTADLAGGAVTDAKVSSVAWGKLIPSSIPSGLSDGDQVGITACSTCRGPVVYKSAAGCSEFITILSTCKTIMCWSSGDPKNPQYRYTNCGGTTCTAYSPVTCSNTIHGYLVT